MRVAWQGGARHANHARRQCLDITGVCSAGSATISFVIATTLPAAASCPVCGQPNCCTIELQRETGIAQGPCWCTQADFGAELLARVPPTARDRCCICPVCAGAAPTA